MTDAVATLAYALYDSENTTRLSEASPAVEKEYFKRAETLLSMIVEYRPKWERVYLADAIQKDPIR